MSLTEYSSQRFISIFHLPEIINVPRTNDRIVSKEKSMLLEQIFEVRYRLLIFENKEMTKKIGKGEFHDF